MMHCLLGAISIASYHLFGSMASYEGTTLYILLSLCILSCSASVTSVLIMCSDLDAIAKMFVFLSLLSFTSLSLISLLILSPWIVIAVVALLVADFILFFNELLFWLIPLIELLYLSVVLTLKDIILMVILIVIMVFELIASLCHSID